METLKPLTVSKSVYNAPTHLLTDDYRSFLLHSPLDQQTLLTHHLSRFLLHHFKLESFNVGVFTLQGKRYYCLEDVQGKLPFDDWYGYLWSDRKKFNHFLKPKDVFFLFLLDVFFPLFGNAFEKYFVEDQKYRVLSHLTAERNLNGLQFNPFTLSQLGLDSPVIKSFFAFTAKEELFHYLMDFISLMHEKFYRDFKYQVSLFAEDRNVYWNEIQKCTALEYQSYCVNLITDYIIRL